MKQKNIITMFRVSKKLKTKHFSLKAKKNAVLGLK